MNGTCNTLSYTEHAVIALAVIAQRLAVVACNNHDGLIRSSTTVRRVQQTADLRISERNLANIRIVEHRPIRFGRVVRPVRIVEVHPQEERRLVHALEPLHRIGAADAKAVLGHPPCEPVRAVRYDDRASRRRGSGSAH